MSSRVLVTLYVVYKNDLICIMQNHVILFSWERTHFSQVIYPAGLSAKFYLISYIIPREKGNVVHSEWGKWLRKKMTQWSQRRQKVTLSVIGWPSASVVCPQWQELTHRRSVWRIPCQETQSVTQSALHRNTDRISDTLTHTLETMRVIVRWVIHRGLLAFFALCFGNIVRIFAWT